MITLKQALSEGIKKISKTSKTPQFDAEVLLSYTLNTSREHILTYPEKIIDGKQLIKFYKLINLRKEYTPVAYLTGHKGFYGLDFKVSKNTLIPRPETEMLVELAIYSIQHETYNKINTTVIDIGTGSGNIIISLAKKIEAENLLPTSGGMLYGLDISQKALAIAKYNAKKNNVGNKIKFLQGNLLQPIIENLKLKIENLIIIANLPYLSKKIYSATIPDVKNFEPKSALLSGIDGLDHYEKLFQQITKMQETRYKIQTIIEISPEQKQKIAKLIRKYFPNATIEFRKDLAKKWRAAILEI